MSQNVIQTSFHAGEWAPALNARVDLAKYHAAVALAENYFVDYRGGLSSRMGTKYILQAKSIGARLIKFQASFNVGYILEFGDKYLRFYNNGSVILETAKTITSITKANPAVVSSAAHGYSIGDWIYISGVLGMTQVNGRYFIIGTVPTVDSFSLTDLRGNPVDSSGYTAYVSGGTAQRIYEIATPYAVADLPLVKFAQNVNQMVLCHPNYTTQVLQINSATDWTIDDIVIGSTATAPTGLADTVSGGMNTATYSYVLTAVDASGQESQPTVPFTFDGDDYSQAAGSVELTWDAVTGALGYNIYRAVLSYAGSISDGQPYGLIGSSSAASFTDNGSVAPDFSQTPPIAADPFSGAGVSSITVTAGGAYTGVTPTISIAGAATAFPIFALNQVISQVNPGARYAVGDTITLANGVVIQVDTVLGGRIQTFHLINSGNTTTVVPADPLNQLSTSGIGTNASFTASWQVVAAQITSPGDDYMGAPAVTFSSGAAAATSTLGASLAGNPAVPGFYQQRLVLAAPPSAPQTFYTSRTGFSFNFDISNPVQDDDAITASIVSGQLNEIKSMVPVPTGLFMLTSTGAWVVNGGSAGAAFTATSVTANAQAFNGASDVPPIVANYDVLYVQSKGSIIRDSAYSVYSNIYTGTDISVLSSHLFFGYQITQWAWAEEPFKLVWAVRNDGVLLALTYLKEQELIGWTHSITNGTFQSVATCTETIQQGSVDAVYLIVQRTVEGSSVQYIERMADRYLSSYVSPWCVDAGLQYNGAAATSFSGGEHLAGFTVTGLADGIPIDPFTMAADGDFTLATAASLVTVGLAFTPMVQTLALDVGEPTIQGKRKKITGVTVRVQDTLGLKIGQTFGTCVDMKDLVLGNLNIAANSIVTNLVTGDARTIVDPMWTEPGQYCILQSLPYPSTILGVIPEIVVGDTK